MELAADQEVSVKNGAELLDRLIKDIVAEKASSYVSTAHSRRTDDNGQPIVGDTPSASQSPANLDGGMYDEEGEPAFSLPRFIPLLAERIYTLNPFTRMFLVNWISLLDSIPDLELISHLPAFLKGLIQFLSDENDDVRTATQQSLNGFLEDIRRSTDVKKMLKERRRLSQAIEESDSASAHSRNPPEPPGVDGVISPIGRLSLNERLPEDNFEETDDWVPGQDLHIDYSSIIEILIPFLSDTGPQPNNLTLIIDQLIQLTALRWLDEFFTICPEDLLPFTPKLLEKVLPSLAHSTTSLDQAAHKVNEDLSNLILSVRQTPAPPQAARTFAAPRVSSISGASGGSATSADEKDSAWGSRETQRDVSSDPFDYYATVNSLTLQFLNEHEETRVAAFEWLIMLHKKAPNRVQKYPSQKGVC